MSDQNPPAGWYPAPHANNEQRYWDGSQWLEPQLPVPVPIASDAPTMVMANGLPPYDPTLTAGATVDPAVAGAAPIAPRKSKAKGWIIGGSIAAGVIVVSSIASALGGGGASNTANEKPPASETTTTTATEVEEPDIELVTVPDVTGQTATEAFAALTAAGLNPPALATLADPLAKVLSTSPAANAEVEEGVEITFTLEEKPKFTVAQQNAIDTAKDYLDYSGFSRTGLIGQLEYEGFTTEESTFGVDNAGADWNAEAAQTAKDYMDYSSFSRQGLYDQLEYEGFLPAEIEFGLAAVGY